MRRTIVTGLTCFLAAAALSAGVAGAAEWTAAPVSARFLKAQTEGKTLSTGGRATGYRPGPIDFGAADAARMKIAAGRTTKRALPAAYDLRTLGRVTAVRDQGAYGTCWAFAALGSLESTLLSAGSAAMDFSEWHLAYFAFADTVSFTSGGDPFQEGGWDWQAVAMLSRWRGAVNEADCPYGGANPTGAEANSAYLRHALHLLQLSPAGFWSSGAYPELIRDTVKQAVIDNGAASIGVWMNTSDPAMWNSATNSLYTAQNGQTSDHAVLIVGWDDAYAAANFATQPAGPGAWIVKNSWGAAWGDDGYFYVSYYEPTLDSGISYIGTTTKPYLRQYSYDPLGWVNNIGDAENDTAWFANIWTAQASESVAAAGFYAYMPNSVYEIRVYRNVTAGNPTSGTMTLAATGTLAETGYHTVPFTTVVPVATGEKFSVVVKLTTPGYNYPVPLEMPLEDYSDQATANAGESFYGLNGTSWTDATLLYANANVCLKAFTQAGAPTVTPTSAPTVTGGGSSGGGGCNAGAASLWTVLLLAPVLAARMKR
jgi:C1A family cysteine protease